MYIFFFNNTQHGFIQAVIAIQLLLLPFTANFFIAQNFDATHILLLRFYGASVASIAIISLLCRNMPNMLPCKRGAGKRNNTILVYIIYIYIYINIWEIIIMFICIACGFLFYHMIMSLVIFQLRNEGPLTVQTSWALSAFHGIQAFVLYAWYTATASQVKAFLKQGQQQAKKD
ncbi:uncharacterized protein BX663DRAFT_252963 [Cokeromyces recurvatus]|uniref:uncharacterized protein n=1 Tax=Cokeromyces recurvatus TaxID=90255 RepID=UPI00222078D7|nr:uncharacterized protein BX663DRAFT_252963 [Cokeromyces recurvatus]KAI7906127.1 hypothetical protein BX663DRAFT_252963 [Cokeromyces recurvatus]